MATQNKYASVGTSTAPVEPQDLTAGEKLLPSKSKGPVVIGVYGVPGSGKTFLLNQLKETLGQDDFSFYEGSDLIASLVPGGLDAFKKLEEEQKVYWRQLAIDKIGTSSAESGQVAVVTGHYMFWPEEDEAGQPVCTQNDLDTFTHILYLDVAAEVVAQRCLDDAERGRPLISSAHIARWQQTEKAELRRLCRTAGILYSVLLLSPTMLHNVAILIRDFRHHTEGHNKQQAESRLDEAISTDNSPLETMLVLDADRTLAPQDTGSLFWKRISMEGDANPLKTLFSSPLHYSYTAFRQATLLYEEVVGDQKFDALCQDVASSVVMYPEFVSLLHAIEKQEHVGALVITCGLRRVWEKVLEREGLSDKVTVIGGGRIADGLVITSAVKASLVTRLQTVHHLYVWAFGDSPLDLEMLSRADEAIVVVGEEAARSKTMNVDLSNAIRDGALRASQVLLPRHVSPRLDLSQLPSVEMSSPKFLTSILNRRRQQAEIQVLHATNRASAKLLMTPMRDSRNAGPGLREAHRRVGWYLATEILAGAVGIEEYPIPHVQGHQTGGYRLCSEPKTTIVALMRGGEAMALGVNDAFPLAMFVHSSRPNDIKLHHLQGQRTLVLVDSVINSGKTVVEFVQHVRSLCATIHIVVVAGVVQAESIAKGSFTQLARREQLTIIALRLSDNKFTGTGTTDTGNRLFNTTHLP